MVSEIDQKINIYLEWFEKNAAVAKSIEDKISNITGTYKGAEKQVSNFTKMMADDIDITKLNSVSKLGFADILGMNFNTWKKLNEQTTKNLSVTGKWGNNLRMITHGMRGFRMELLGAMFLGLGMQKMFMGLLQPALDAFGVFDLISTVLLVLLIPAMEILMPIIVGISTALMDMPDWLKLIVGGFIMLGAIVGTILFTLSSLGLGLGSTITAFGGIVTFILGLIPAISGAITAIVAAVAGAPIALVAVIVGIIAALLLAIIFNVEGFVGAFVNFFVNMFVSMKDIIMGGLKAIFGFFQMIFGAIVGLVTGDFSMMNEGIKNFIDGIKQWFTGFFNFAIGNWLRFGYDLLVAFATGIGRAYAYVKEAIRGIPVIGPIIVGGIDIATSIASKIASTVGNIAGNARAAIKSVFGFAEGGIVTRPTLGMVGEAGPEAIIPLSKAGGIGSSYYNISPTYYVTANISKDVDERELANRLNAMLVDDYRRLTIR